MSLNIFPKHPKLLHSKTERAPTSHRDTLVLPYQTRPETQKCYFTTEIAAWEPKLKFKLLGLEARLVRQNKGFLYRRRRPFRFRMELFRRPDLNLSIFPKPPKSLHSKAERAPTSHRGTLNLSYQTRLERFSSKNKENAKRNEPKSLMCPQTRTGTLGRK